MTDKIKAIWRIIRAKQWAVVTDRKEGGTACLWGILGGLPKRAKAWDYADIILNRAAYLCTAMRLHSEKIMKCYRPDYNDIKEIEIPEGKRAEWVDGVLTLVDEQPKDITERIKTFEDAMDWCEKNGFESLCDDFNAYYKKTPDILAYLKLRIITCALNEGWKPTFEEKEGRCFVCADEIATDEISVCSADGVISYNESAMLLFKSSELAEYAATQFKDIYMDFCYKGKE